MKNRKKLKGRLLSALLILCMVLTFIPATAFADTGGSHPCSQTADFTIGDGTEALALLNAAKTGTDDCTWEKNAKILTLKGVNFDTSATTAVKLPTEATIILADDTENQIKGGDASISVGGTSTYPAIYGIYAEGNLTIKGETAGTGTLTVTSGNHTNSGDADTYSTGLYGKGNLNIVGGNTTMNGGSVSVESGSYAFSDGIRLGENGNLSVTGGTLTAVGGETHCKGSLSFSRGINVYKGNITVNNNAVLEGKCVPAMNSGGLLANGIKILIGDLIVSDNAQVKAAAPDAINVTGNMNLSGGKIAAKSTAENGGKALRVETASYLSSTYPKQGNLTVSGGILELGNGGLSVYAYNAKPTQGNLAVTGGTIKTPSIYGPELMTIEGGCVESGSVTTGNLTLSGGKLKATEKAEIDTYTNNLNAPSAVYCREKLTVSGGFLEAAWDWGTNTPIVFPANQYGYIIPLISGKNAVITGGTVLLDTGCGGNTAMEAELTLGSNVAETGGDELNQIQKYSDTPVVFSDISKTNLTVSGIAVKTKAYDATKNAEFDTSGVALSGVQSGDTVSLGTDNVTASFDSKDVGTDKSVSVSGTFDLRGKDAYKYTLTQPTTEFKGNITPCTTVINTTNSIQKVTVCDGNFESPIISGVFGEPDSGNEIIETATGSLTYTIPDSSVTDGSKEEVIEYLKTLDVGKTVEITYTFTGSGNYNGARFDDGNGTMTNKGKINATINNIIILPASPTYEITEGKNSTWTQNSDGTLSFRANGTLSKFVCVKVDDVTIDADKYTAVSGSTVVTLKSDYLAILSVGKHKLTVVYNDGDCSTDFEVKAAETTQDTTPVVKPAQRLNTFVSAGSSQIKLSWSKIKDADGYYIYGNRCGKTPKKLKTVNGTVWTQKNLRKGGIYMYQVKAYKKTSDGTKILKSSVQIHVATLGSKLTNAKSVNTTFTEVTLPKGKSKQIRATITRRNPKEKPVSHVSKFRYRTNCSKIATVSKSGEIKAVGTGTCSIYVYANNGVFKKITVKVK